jgi:hypothetical protein
MKNESDDRGFFLTEMPVSRSGDFHLGLDGSVFLDFNVTGNRISLVRISFDGYGCCDLASHAIPLTEQDCELFRHIVDEKHKDQESLMRIVRSAIRITRGNIWEDALVEYKLI